MKLAQDHNPYEISRKDGKENELMLGLSHSGGSGALKKRSRDNSARGQKSGGMGSNVLGLTKAGKL
jgi:hypothetical protein